jgi:hypothetical protein
MAAIAFNVAHQKQHARERLKTLLASLHEMLDAFVSNRVQRTAAEAEYAGPRQFQGPAAQPLDTAMIAMTLTCPDLSPRQTPRHSDVANALENERATMAPAHARATVSTLFVPLDPGIVNETIPAFFIGRNKEGFWIARDANGQIGGIFLLENSALSFARSNCRSAGCATIYLSERFELDLENKGNPLAVQLASATRFAQDSWQRSAAFIGKMTEAVKRRLKDF